MSDPLVITGVVTGLSSLSFIFLKAFQQLNVVHHKVLMVLPTSMAMAGLETYVVDQMAHYGFGWIVWPIGIGSGLGAILAMYFHQWIRGLKRA